jgi:hypothetical protein
MTRHLRQLAMRFLRSRRWLGGTLVVCLGLLAWIAVASRQQSDDSDSVGHGVTDADNESMTELNSIARILETPRAQRDPFASFSREQSPSDASTVPKSLRETVPGDAAPMGPTLNPTQGGQKQPETADGATSASPIILTNHSNNVPPSQSVSTGASPQPRCVWLTGTIEFE